MAAWLSHSDTGYRVDEYRTELFRIYRKLPLRAGGKLKVLYHWKNIKTIYYESFSLIYITLLGIRVHSI